jgi:photosystem II stability/assembly factor-like uncharacterized protein
MKRFLVLIFSFFLFPSCQSQYQPREITSIEIKEIRQPEISIRAISVIDSSRVLFAGSDGAYGIKIYEPNWDILDWDVPATPPLLIKYQDSILPNFRSVAYNNKDHFVLSIGNPALLYKLEFNKNPKLVYKEEHEKVFYDSMKFFDEQHGIAMGDPTEDCLSIILTKDGGTTWNKIPCSKMPKVADGEAAFAASNTNIKVLGKTAWIVTGGTKARVFKTTNLGETWEVYETPIIQGEGAQGIYSVDFADENHGIIIGGDYSKPEENKANKAITKDGGKTWTLVADGQNPNYKSCVQYVPNTDGKEVFAVGKTGISYSNDGGITWREVSKEGYYVIQFVDRNTAWLAGNEKIGRFKLKK